MDILTAPATSQSPSSLINKPDTQAIGIAVLNKSLDSQVMSAASMLSHLPPVIEKSRLPSHLGQNINTTA